MPVLQSIFCRMQNSLRIIVLQLLTAFKMVLWTLPALARSP